MRGMRVAVAGAGIGGLAAAAALCRAGCRVRVFEQAPVLRAVGAGLHLGSNGSRILHRWGLADELRAVAVRPTALEVRDGHDGRLLFRQPMDRAWEAAFQGPYYTVHRADLHRILADRLPAEAIRVGHRLVGFAEQDDTVRLEFATDIPAEGSEH